MMKKIYRTVIVTIFLVSIAMPAIAGSEPVAEKMQQHSGQMETHQVMEHGGKEMKEMSQTHNKVKGTDQGEQETEQEMQKKH
jgi:hypothetical protein